MRPQTIAERIITEHAREKAAWAGAITIVTPDILLLNDVSGPLAFDQFAAMGALAPAAPERVVLVADHFAPASDVHSAISAPLCPNPRHRAFL
jgi:3-isopropylmalate/(R)-2-methylmalate dehydratase large subunit